MIVDHDSKLVGIQAVGTLDDEVTQLPVEALHLRTLHPINKGDRLVVHFHPPCYRRFYGSAAGPTSARINTLAMAIERCGFQSLSAAAAWKQTTGAAERLERPVIAADPIT